MTVLINNLVYSILTAVLLLLQANVYAEVPAGSVRTITAFDVPRYMGTWYEIAKFPNWFQKKCLSNTKAVYSIRSDGNVQVLNSCTTAGGEVSVAEGVARQLGGSSSARLEVRFAPAWLSFLPLVWGDYWVIDLDPQYQVAAVSDPKREYLWILSRTPQIDAGVYEQLVLRLEQQQFDVRKLEKTTQLH